MTFNSRQNSNSDPELVIVGDSSNAPLHRGTRTAVITNTALAKSRAAGTSSQLPVIPRNPSDKQVPSCDEPVAGYLQQDTLASLSPITISGVSKLHVIDKRMKPVVYPNPLQKSFHIQFPTDYEGEYRMQMIDLVGRIYELGTAILQRGGSDVTLDISKMSLKPGLYFLRSYRDNKPTDVLKLLIQY